MSYLLVMWNEKGAGGPVNTKVEDLTESGGLVRLPLGAGSYSIQTQAINGEAARAYRKAEANGENPIEAVVNHYAEEEQKASAAKEAENAATTTTTNAVQQPNPGDNAGEGENSGGDGQV